MLNVFYLSLTQLMPNQGGEFTLEELGSFSLDCEKDKHR